MTAAEWRRIKGILAHALECPAADQRKLLLDRSCGADVELRAEVESLLAQRPGPIDDFELLRSIGLNESGDPLPDELAEPL